MKITSSLPLLAKLPGQRARVVVPFRSIGVRRSWRQRTLDATVPQEPAEGPGQKEEHPDPHQPPEPVKAQEGSFVPVDHGFGPDARPKPGRLGRPRRLTEASVGVMKGS